MAIHALDVMPLQYPGSTQYLLINRSHYCLKVSALILVVFRGNLYFYPYRKRILWVHKILQWLNNKWWNYLRHSWWPILPDQWCHNSQHDVTQMALILNTDGITPFKSNIITMWPITLMITNMPYSQRILPKNMLLAGLWYGKEKPIFSIFMKLIIESLQKLERGIYM